MKMRIFLPTIVLTGMALVSCGGGSSGGDTKTSGNVGFSGMTTPAEITTNNADDLSVAATAGTRAAIDQGNVPTGGKVSPNASILLAISSDMARRHSTANRTANQEIPNVCSSGSASFESNADNTAFTYTYSNCTLAYGSEYGGTVTADGVMRYQQNSDGSFNFSYENFTVTYLGETTTFNMNVSCDSTYQCTYQSDFKGLDGRIYRVEGASVSTTDGYTYNVSATVYDPDFGSITIDANVTYGSCSTGVPQSGSITYTGSGGSSGSVVYNDCDSFTVTLNGVSTTYLWADILVG